MRVPTSKGRNASSAVAKSKDMKTSKKVSPEIRMTMTKKKSQSQAGVSSKVQPHRQADHASASLEQPTQTRRITIDAVLCHLNDELSSELKWRLDMDMDDDDEEDYQDDEFCQFIDKSIHLVQ